MRALLVGDTHGNGSWLERVLGVATSASVDRIVQLGDFGWWPRQYTSDAFVDIARASPVPLWWIDGNHEDHGSLASAVGPSDGPDDEGVIGLGGNLSYVPRGTRVSWDGVTVVFCGGAHSIDRSTRIDGISWFDAEHVSDADVAASISGGHADVLLCHDAPAGWRIPDLPSDRGLPHVWQVELPACEAHRRQVGRIFDAVTPALVAHDHYHVAYRRQLDADWGPVDIIGLSADGSTANIAVLDCQDGACNVVPVDL